MIKDAVNISPELIGLAEIKAKSDNISLDKEIERLVKIGLHFDTNLSPEFVDKFMNVDASNSNEAKSFEFHETVDKGQRLLNTMVAQYGKAIDKESSKVDANLSLIKVYQNNIEVLKETSRSLINLPENQVINTTKKYSAIHKANLEKNKNDEPLANTSNVSSQSNVR